MTKRRPEYLTGTEAGKVLRTTAANLRRMLDEDRIDYVETGKRAYVVRRVDFDEWRLEILPGKRRISGKDEAAMVKTEAQRKVREYLETPDWLLPPSQRREKKLRLA